MTIRVVLVDDEPLIRHGARALLETDPGMEIVAEAGDGRAAIDAVRRHRPDVVLMDLIMPIMDGIEATGVITALPEAPAVVVLTTSGLDESVIGSLQAGAAGFVLKTTAPDEVLAAVRSAAAGETPLSPSIAGLVVDAVRATGSDGVRREAEERFGSLTPKEQEVAFEASAGLTTAAAARRLFISPSTFRTHLEAIYAKWGVRSRTEVAWWVAHARPAWRPPAA